jgi:hypothetical protein
MSSNGAVLAVALWEGSDESSVGIAKGYWLDGRDFLSFTVYSLTLEPIQPPIEQIPGASPWINAVEA